MLEPRASTEIEQESRTFQAEAAGITSVDTWAEAVGRRWNIDERANFKARVCIAEIAGNVMEHGIASEAAEFTVTLRHHATELEVEMVDSGRPFDPTTALELSRPQSIESARIGGLGLNLVRSLTSAVTYCHDGRHNCLRLIFPL